MAVGNRVLLYNTENGDLIDSLRGDTSAPPPCDDVDDQLSVIHRA